MTHAEKKVYLLKVVKRVLQSFYKRQESIPEQIPHVPSGAVCLLTPSELRDRSVEGQGLDQDTVFPIDHVVP